MMVVMSPTCVIRARSPFAIAADIANPTASSPACLPHRLLRTNLWWLCFVTGSASRGLLHLVDVFGHWDREFSPALATQPHDEVTIYGIF